MVCRVRRHHEKHTQTSDGGDAKITAPKSLFKNAYFVADVFEVHSQPTRLRSKTNYNRLLFGCRQQHVEPRAIGAYSDASNPNPVPPDFDDDVWHVMKLYVTCTSKK